MRLYLALALMVVAVPALLAAPPSAFAQTRAEMNQKIEALEKQLRAVQRRVFDQDSPYFRDEGGAPSSPSPSAAGSQDSAGSAGNAGLLADLTVRVEELSSQLSALTGQVEELRHENRQLRERLSRFEQDVNLRLRRLEAGGQGGIGVSGPASAQSQIPADGRFSDVESSVDDASTATSGNGPEVGAAPSPARPQGTPQEQYDHAYGLLRRGQMEEAEQAFRAFLDRHGDHSLAANAQYWLGETYYVRQEYPQAAQAFLSGYQDYAEGGKAADSLLKLGMTLAAMGQTDDACAAFDELESRFPDLEERVDRRMTSERRRLGCG